MAVIVISDIVRSTTPAIASALDEFAGRIAAEHGGRVVKTTEHALMVEFQQVANALRAATGLAESFQEAELRTGVHLGSATEGINLASGLQTAAPGEVIITAGVLTALGDASRYQFESIPENTTLYRCKLRRLPQDDTL